MTDSTDFSALRDRLPSEATASRDLLEALAESVDTEGNLELRSAIGALTKAIVQLEFEIKGIHASS